MNTTERTKLPKLLQKQSHNFEQILKNPRAYYAYAQSKTKVKEGINRLLWDDGMETNSVLEPYEVLNSEFMKVFMQEGNEPFQGGHPYPLQFYDGRHLEGN